jgi:ribosome-binding protein aMBF1 (putative translation factor)
MAMETCPVCGWDMQDGGIKIKVAGRELTVCCDACAEKARAEAEQREGR